MEKGLYQPELGQPIFGAGEDVLIAGFARHLSRLPAMTFVGFNTTGDNAKLAEPWIPKQSPVFDVAGSSMAGIATRRDDQIRCYDLFFQERTIRVAALSRLQMQGSFENDTQTYLIMSDPDGVGNAWRDLVTDFNDDEAMTAARFRSMARNIENLIVSASLLVLHRLAIQHPGFFVSQQTKFF